MWMWNFHRSWLVLIKLISIGSYFPEVFAFGTLIMSTGVFRPIFCKIIWLRPWSHLSTISYLAIPNHALYVGVAVIYLSVFRLYCYYPARAAWAWLSDWCWCPYIYVYMFVDQKKFESYFSDRLTFSNIHGRTSQRIYRLALWLWDPETLSSSSKSRIFWYNVHLTLFVRKMTQLW